VRILSGVTLAAVCLTLASCASSRSAGTKTASTGGTSTPFQGSPPASAPASAPAVAVGEPRSAPDATPVKSTGMLAGRVLDGDSRLKPGAIIQVIDLDGPRDGGAPLKILANKEGYFDIAGLEGGHSYRLVAQVKDGARILTGTVRVVAPNVRVAIFLNEERPLNEGPLDRPSPAPRSVDGSAGTSSGPPAALGRPIRSPSDGVTIPLPSGDRGAGIGTTPGLPPPVSSGDPSLIAEKDVQDGFTRSVPAEIVGPGREPSAPSPTPRNYLPPPLPDTLPSGEGTTTPLPGSPGIAVPSAPEVAWTAPTTRTRIPSCVKVGNQVDNLALLDINGKPWELAKQGRNHLVLLDFCWSGCGPCRQTIPHLIDLQNKYGRYGLQVVGISYEEGTLAEKQKAVSPLRMRYGINYTLLFGGDGSCPVRKQFEVTEYPTLVLLDTSGKVVFRTRHGQGVDANAVYDLEIEIRKQLGMPLR
jgi:thiol-disulfide isomerase/thioredoxin